MSACLSSDLIIFLRYKQFHAINLFQHKGYWDFPPKKLSQRAWECLKSTIFHEKKTKITPVWKLLKCSGYRWRREIYFQWLPMPEFTTNKGACRHGHEAAADDRLQTNLRSSLLLHPLILFGKFHAIQMSDLVWRAWPPFSYVLRTPWAKAHITSSLLPKANIVKWC